MKIREMDPLDLFDDDGDGTIEMSLLEEEQKLKKGRGRSTNTGCSVAFLIIGSSLAITGWFVIQIL